MLPTGKPNFFFRHKVFFYILGLLILLFFGSKVFGATTSIASYDPTITDGEPIGYPSGGNYSGRCQEFLTDANSYELDSIKIRNWKYNSGADGSAYIYAVDEFYKPTGSAISTVDVYASGIGDSGSPGSFRTYSVTGNLSADTIYALCWSANGDSSNYNRWADDYSTAGYSERSLACDSGFGSTCSVWDQADFAFEVIGTVSEAPPAAETNFSLILALILLVLAALFFLDFMRRLLI